MKVCQQTHINICSHFVSKINCFKLGTASVFSIWQVAYLQ